MDATPPTPATTEESGDETWAIPMPGESDQWFQRASLFFAMGAARSVRGIYNAELVQRGKASERSKAVPSSWTQASKIFKWKIRAQAFDAWRRKEIFATGNAQDTERIKKLSVLIDKLCERCLAMLDLPIIEAEFNPDAITKLVGQLLAAIDLMAKHTGGYATQAQRVEVTGKDGAEIEVKQNVLWYMPDVAPLPDVGPGDGSDADSAEQPGGS